MTQESAVVIVFAILVAGGLTIVISGMRHRARILEMMHRERIAMIDKGIVPPPERDPELFEQNVRQRRGVAAQRMQSVGIVTIGFGLALALLLTITARAPEIGLGIGGSIVVLGAALLVNSRLATPVEEQRTKDKEQRTEL